jgi:sugar phosphate isomerase/epimerase
MEFGSGYQMPMDRGFDYQASSTLAPATSPAEQGTNDVGVKAGDFGISVGLGPVPNVGAIKSKLYAGSKKMEFVFTGAQKGSGQGQTPEQYGLKQRQALTEIGKVNQVDFTTHSTVGIMGLAGQDNQGNFSKQAKTMSLMEIKRAIEFAADVANGGPVVVHTGEFHRPVADADWNQKEGDAWANKFEMYGEEADRTTFRVVDERSGGVIAEARKNKKVSRPVWKRYNADHDQEFWDEKGGSAYKDIKGNPVHEGDYIDYEGNLVEMRHRVPVYSKKEGNFMTTEYGWPELKNEAKEMTKRAREEFNEWENYSTEQKKDSLWRERIEEAKALKKNAEDIIIKPEEAYIIATLETQAANARGYSHYYGAQFDDLITDLKKLKQARGFYQKIQDTTDPEEQWRLKKQAGKFGDLVPEESKFPTQILDEQIKKIETNIKHSQETAAAQWSQAAEAEETIRHVKSAEDYALNEAYDSYAQAAISAMRHSDKLEKQGKLKKPMFIALENLFPESYGAHPDELMKLVQGSRNKMVHVLKANYNMTEEQAKKEAEEHINTTMDTGHLNIWRKYWKGDPKKSMQENDEQFDKWMLDKIGEMTRKKMIGHIHIDDNYGYHDDHLAPGEGNTPIKQMVKVLKENGYKGEMIVEPGADYYTDVGGFQSVMKTWKLFGNTAYGSASGISPRAGNWGKVNYGWFGQTQPAYFTFGGYIPSDEWTMWSGVQLE